MIYFYTELLSNYEVLFHYFVQTLPFLIVYIATIKYCLHFKMSRAIIVLITIPTFILGGVFNFLVQIYFQKVMVVHDIFTIQCQFIMFLILYVIYHRGDFRMQLNLLIVTIITILYAGTFSYIRIFLINYSDNYFFSVYIVNWYFLSFLLFLPLVKKTNNWGNILLLQAPKITLLFSWIVSITIVCFFIFNQVNSVTTSYNDEYSSVIFLSSEYIGIPFLKKIAPSALFIIEPVSQVVPFGTLLVIGATLLIGSFFFLICSNMYSKQKLAHQEQIKFELTQYVNTLESLTQNIRKSHHDFSNILFSLGGYIFQPSINDKKLKAYYQSITQTFEKDYHHFIEISKLKNLEIPELKTLIFTKLMLAEKNGIPFDLEIEQTIHQLPLDSLSLTRICGILIDNALEAAQESEKPFVRLALIEDEASYIFILINSMKSEDILPLLSQENFSTKGKNRGLGLSIVRGLLHNHKKTISLKTTQKNNEFQQTIIFKKET